MVEHILAPVLQESFFLFWTFKSNFSITERNRVMAFLIYHAIGEFFISHPMLSEVSDLSCLYEKHFNDNKWPGPGKPACVPRPRLPGLCLPPPPGACAARYDQVSRTKNKPFRYSDDSDECNIPLGRRGGVL